MKLISKPARRRRLARLPAGPAGLALPAWAAGHVLAAASLNQGSNVVTRASRSNTPADRM